MEGTAARDDRALRHGKPRARRHGPAGLTLIELIVAFSLMLILSLMALPVASVKIQREQERRLRHALVEIRTAIDRHKDMADEGKLQGLDTNNYGYPESLEVLVGGIDLDPDGDRQGLGPGSPGSARRALSEGAGNRGGIGSFGSNSGLGSMRGAGSAGGDEGAFGSRRGLFGRDDEGPEFEGEPPQSIRFLRAIPVDPMTGRREWGLLSVSDDPLSRSWSGRNVFDVYSLSNATALDGTRYSEW